MVVSLDKDGLFIAFSVPAYCSEDFVMSDYLEWDEVSRSPFLFCFADDYLFPEIKIEEVCPELIIFAEAVKDVYGLTMRYAIPPRYDSRGRLVLEPFADEFVVTTCKDVEGNEFLEEVVTPLGSFGLLFFLEIGEGIYTLIDFVLFTDEIRQVMFLRQCETETEETHCTVRYIANRYLENFPPGDPSQYIFGSSMYDEAKRYWDEFGEREPENVWGKLFDDEGRLISQELEGDLEDWAIVAPDGEMILPTRNEDGNLEYDFGSPEAYLAWVNSCYEEGSISEVEYNNLIEAFSEPEYFDYVIRI